MSVQAPKRLGFIGLGAMGSRLAYRLANFSPQPLKVLGYDINISSTSATTINNKYLSNIDICSNIHECMTNCDYIMTCLPTSGDVNNVIDEYLDYTYNCNSNESYNPQEEQEEEEISHPIWLDCTSGTALESKRIGNKLLTQYKMHFLDCPVSGGVCKAEKGEIACMVGCNDSEIYNQCRPLLSCFANYVENVGNVGTGHAIKAINNLLNVSNLLVVTEGLSLLLKNFAKDGDDDNDNKDSIKLLETALNAINHSSGRSLMSQERWPTHIIDGKYNYDFMLGLMLKDVKNALKLDSNNENENKNKDENDSDDKIRLQIAPTVEKMLEKGVEKYGYDADYTESVKLYFDIHNKTGQTK